MLASYIKSQGPVLPPSKYLRLFASRWDLLDETHDIPKLKLSTIHRLLVKSKTSTCSTDTPRKAINTWISAGL